MKFQQRKKIYSLLQMAVKHPWFILQEGVQQGAFKSSQKAIINTEGF
jgi:hypothetical protein